ncbi:hypothetical protein JAAARDRAFT_34097 [Jaapia argillacea MUCL 33604]|uniref:Anaphase-promoting complex subunit 4 WD40 domain-containing protein n=1 Tax=Jaapia argillacea MUCL 33604 TaxID=933084 RepID=A0A067PZS5_9AGAM|nr:hypothetical protein JAAARDRAFT_34097 [Jaapia argillacea MUCL 33604]
MSFFGTSASAPTPLAVQDIEVADPPTDSVSSLAFAPAADFLAAGSWDNHVRIYEVNSTGRTQGKAMYSHEGPVLSVCWNKEGTKLISGGVDNAARMFDLTTGQSQQVAAHDSAVKVVKWIDSPQGGILATASWDKTVKYWDLRSAQPIGTINFPERCYAMDVTYPLMVVGTADRKFHMVNLSNPMTIHKTITSPLSHQTRVVACSNTGDSFAMGSVEGRVGVHFVDEKNFSKNFTFRCHRREKAPNMKDQSLVFAVNDLAFHPVQGTLSSCGSDGVINIWDTDARVRVKNFDPCPGPVSATCFNRNGTILAYAVSYDWSKGHSGMTPGHVNKLMLHACKDDEVKKKLKR